MKKQRYKKTKRWQRKMIMKTIITAMKIVNYYIELSQPRRRNPDESFLPGGIAIVGNNVLPETLLFPIVPKIYETPMPITFGMDFAKPSSDLTIIYGGRGYGKTFSWYS